MIRKKTLTVYWRRYLVSETLGLTGHPFFWVNRHNAENQNLTKCRKPFYSILAIFFLQKDVLVQNAEFGFADKT
jgi:hypothetical protein